MKTSYDRIRLPILSALIVLVSALGSSLQAQNTSYNLNSAPILGSNNVAFGVGALPSNTQYNNTAIGSSALFSNTSGVENTAIGHQAMILNTTGIQNTALGMNALLAAGGASGCVSVGYASLISNTASNNTAVGTRAMLSNTSGSLNTVLGFEAMYYNQVGASNTAVGYRALNQNTGGGNTALGDKALQGNVNSNHNVAVGREAILFGASGDFNAALGYRALYGTIINASNTGLGSFSSVSATTTVNSTAVGANAIANTSNKVRLGSATVTKVEGPVAYTVSDGRFKTDVREDDVKGLDFIEKLRPVVYHFDTRAFTEHLTQDMPDSLRQHYLAEDFAPSTAIRQSGFIAQEVEAAAKAAGYDFNGVSAPTHDGDNYSLAYGQFVVPLVKAVQEQQAQIAELKAQVRALQAAQGTEPAASKALSVFPNPSHGNFTVATNTPDATRYEVRDITGRLVSLGSLSAEARTRQLDLSAEAKGSYVLRVFAGDRLLGTEKLILE